MAVRITRNPHTAGNIPLFKEYSQLQALSVIKKHDGGLTKRCRRVGSRHYMMLKSLYFELSTAVQRFFDTVLQITNTLTGFGGILWFCRLCSILVFQ